MDSIKIKYLKKLLSSLITKGASSFIKIGSVALLIKLLGVDEYGVYIIGMSIFLLVQTISRIGIDLYIQQQSSRHTNDIDKVNLLIGIIFISSFISVFLMLPVIFLVKYYANGVAYDIWIYFILTAPFYSICWNFTYLLRGLERVKSSILLMEVSLPTLQLLVFAAGYYLFSWGSEGAIISLLLACVITAIVFISLFLNRSEFSIIVNYEYFCDSIGRSKRFLAVAVTSMLLVWSDTYFIAYYMQPKDVALYGIIAKLGMIILIPVAVITVYTNNFTSDWYKQGGTLVALKSQLRMNIGIILIILFVLLGFLLWASPYVFEYFEEPFTVELRNTLKLYLLAQCIFAVSGPIDSIFLMGTRQDVITKINLAMVIVNILLCAFLIPEYGLVGAGLSTLISVVIAKSAQLYILFGMSRVEFKGIRK